MKKQIEKMNMSLNSLTVDNELKTKELNSVKKELEIQVNSLNEKIEIK